MGQAFGKQLRCAGSFAAHGPSAWAGRLAELVQEGQAASAGGSAVIIMGAAWTVLSGTRAAAASLVSRPVSS